MEPCRTVLLEAAESALRALCCGAGSSALLDSLRSMREEGTGCDVTLRCEGERFRCHAVVVAAQGDFWKTLLFGLMAKCVASAGASFRIIYMSVPELFSHSEPNTKWMLLRVDSLLWWLQSSPHRSGRTAPTTSARRPRTPYG